MLCCVCVCVQVQCGVCTKVLRMTYQVFIAAMITCCWPPCVLSPRAAPVDSTLWPQSVQTLDPDTHLFAGFCDNPSVQLWPSAVILSEGELKCPPPRHIADTISNLRSLRQLSHGKHEW